MTYYGGKDLAEAFRTVRKNTIGIAQDIPAEKYSYRATPGTRSVGETLTHIALSYGFQYQVHAKERRTTLEGFDFPAMVQRFTAEEKAPLTKEQIIELLRANGDKFAAWLEAQPDDFLAERVQMRAGMAPGSKTRFEMIMSVKEHEMHHRGQLMLMERIIGITPHLTREMQARFAAAANAAAAKK
jgi:uncharacterized damage-inducible protein DinB